MNTVDKMLGGLKVFTCDTLPPDQILFITPGEAVDIVDSEGKLLKRITVRAPRIDVIYNISVI